MAASDAFSAITADRPYRRARTALEALSDMRGSAGQHHDKRVVEALAGIIAADALPALAA